MKRETIHATSETIHARSVNMRHFPYSQRKTVFLSSTFTGLRKIAELGWTKIWDRSHSPGILELKERNPELNMHFNFSLSKVSIGSLV